MSLVSPTSPPIWLVSHFFRKEVLEYPNEEALQHWNRPLAKKQGRKPKFRAADCWQVKNWVSAKVVVNNSKHSWRKRNSPVACRSRCRQLGIARLYVLFSAQSDRKQVSYPRFRPADCWRSKIQKAQKSHRFPQQLHQYDSFPISFAGRSSSILIRKHCNTETEHWTRNKEESPNSARLIAGK
jgi:hypothetical protein